MWRLAGALSIPRTLIVNVRGRQLFGLLLIGSGVVLQRHHLISALVFGLLFGLVLQRHHLIGLLCGLLIG